ncbi:MAG TPA: hypothetical protein VGN34_06135 [Ktedonobacteraceae bacterium]
MGQTHLTRHRCGYTLVREAVIDFIDVGSGLHLPCHCMGKRKLNLFTGRLLSRFLRMKKHW